MDTAEEATLKAIGLTVEITRDILVYEQRGVISRNGTEPLANWNPTTKYVEAVAPIGVISDPT